MIGIRVVSLADRPMEPPVAAWFGTDGGDIGRSQDCTLALPDAERSMSRRQAAVVHREGRFYIRPLSISLPLELNERPLTTGDEVELLAGAQIRIGAYRLEVLEEPDSLGVRGPAGAAPVRRGAFADLLQGLPPAAAGAAMPAPEAARGGGPAEVDLLVGDTAGLRSSGPAPAPQAIHAPPFEPPAPKPEGEAAPLDVAAALFDGLGMSAPTAAQRMPEQIRLIGELLRAMTGGTLDLLAARTVAKRELGANPTYMKSRENNPLKFSPDVDAALMQLLGPERRGFLAAPAAVQEAFDDLRAHQVAMLAGMRAALDSVMSRFDPAALEQRLAPGASWESLIPAHRKAKLWSEYSAQFARIVSEVEGDFDALLGRAFLNAYRAQLAELARSEAEPDDDRP